MDTFNLCRSCMKEVASWERKSYDSKTVEKFRFCTNIEVLDADKMPKQFCYDCVGKIEATFIYITKAQEVDAILKNIIPLSFSSVIVKPESCEKSVYKCTNDNIDDDHISYNDMDAYDETIDFRVKEDVSVEKETKFSNTSQVSNVTENINEIKMYFHSEERKRKQNKTVMKDIVDEAKKNHVCPICRKKFTSKIWFSKHMENDHNGNKYVCQHCNKKFVRKWELTQHSACHTEERKYACPECGKCFKRRNQVAAHAKCHIDCKPFECDHCGMKFKFKSALQTHMLVHYGKKPYLCNYCGKKFAQAGTLKVHMHMHTGQKPYHCKECSFRSSVASSLRRHERIHSRAKTYVCKHCGKGFYDNSGLLRHVRIHTGELPYKCPNCSRSFIDGWKRKTHLMRAHHLDLDNIPPMNRDGTLQQ